jgi:hypothetical protein
VGNTWQCAHCTVAFAGLVLTLNRAYERVHFSRLKGPARVEIQEAAGAAAYCSRSCFDLHLPLAMAELSIPIPRRRPSIGPVESCARCDRPVDMSDWHLTVTASLEFELDWGMQPLDVDYVAVLCRTCLPYVSARSQAESHVTRKD